MKNKGAKPKFKRKGSSGAFGCDLTEYLESSGQDVPLVLKSCAEFIETHGVVDGIYRLSGVTSNIQKLRQEFGSDQCPDLTKEVYLQDIHCVGSLCKLYFRELPNPLLTYQLYKKFTDAVSCSAEGDQLTQIQNVVQELPPSHYRTLEYLSKHLTHIASHSAMTNMHIRNLALVWAPNLLRSKEIEDAGCNGDAAFLEVRVQQVVIEFILNHVDQIFSTNPPSSPKPFPRDECRVIVKSMTLPSGSSPMKLVSLQEAQAMSLSATHPARKERRENSLPEIVPPLFHTVIDLPENKRKLSTKSKKWKSIFNLGRSGADSKSKLSRNGSVFVRGQKEMNEKAAIRPAKSMDSLCSLPAEGEEEKVSLFKRSVGAGGFFIPMPKSRAAGSGSAIDVSKNESEYETESTSGATGGSRSGQDKANPKTSQVKALPEQMKVFRVGEDMENEQTSPKVRKMFYASSDGSAKSSFPASLFPLEASPRHQRKAINISEPFSVSVPLRVSAVISSNSTPCRGSSKDRHFLSSLEELPLLEPNPVAELAVLDVSINPGLRDQNFPLNPGEKAEAEEPKPVSTKPFDSPDLPGSEAGDSTKDMKTAPLEVTSSHPKAEGKLSPEREPMSIADLEKALSMEPAGCDAGSIETVPKDVEELFDNDQEDDASSVNLLDPTWSDIQQELKIVESEEDLTAVPEYMPESKVMLPPPEQEASLSSSPTRSSDEFLCSPASPELSESRIPSSFVLDNVTLEGANQNAETKTSSLTQLENVTASPHGIPPIDGAMLPGDPQDDTDRGQSSISMKETWSNLENGRDESEMDFIKRGNPGLRTSESQTESDCTTQVISDAISLKKREDLEVKRTERKSNGSLDNDEDTGVDGILDEFWEDHQWVTSPLHSPKLKNVPDRQVSVMPPKRRGTTGELYKRPEFTRSLSLDSKDSRTCQWTRRHAGMRKPEGLTNVWMETNSFRSSSLTKNPGPTQDDHKYLNPPVLPSLGTPRADQKTDQRQQNEPVFDVFCQDDRGTPISILRFSDVSVHSGDGLSELQTGDSPSVVSNPEHTVHNFSNNTEESTGRPKTRPSSLTLDPSITTSTYFTFENTSSSMDSSTRAQHINPMSSSTKQSTPDRSIPTPQWKGEPWALHPPLPIQVDCTPAIQTPPGRRNSAPVSVSAVRASFMIKLCQAKAVPVIPPKVQYTQIPQPLQTVNADTEVPPQPEKKATTVNSLESNFTHQQTLTTNTGHGDVSKSPKPERKAVEEKENSDPVALDPSHHSSVNLSPESSYNGSQDAPVLRRKRTSGGESPGDTPLSSKIERPTLISKPSFRSRPGRPQSLILFSPPFPIMDHPSPADSRILLSPIKNPSQEPTGESLRTPDGVMLRNKLTIPKNGQRLETSTSCFYQPQRRSVILDGRNGRQIE